MGVEGPRWSWWVTIGLFPTLLCVGTALALEFSDLDALSIEPWFNRATTPNFPLQGHWFFANVLHSGARWVTMLAAAALLLVAVLGRWWQGLRRIRPQAIYLLCCYLVTTGVNGLIKACSNRFSPWSLDRFGGEVPYTTLFQGTPEPWHGGHSFPAGHASAAFAWVSLWYVGRSLGDPRPAIWLSPGLLAGFIFAWTQHVRGAHFPSHNFWTLSIAWIVATLFAALFAWRGWMPQAFPLREHGIQRPIVFRYRPWIIGFAGALLGSAVFAIDTGIEILGHESEGAHFTMEVLEYALIGPGLGVSAFLLAQRWYDLQQQAQQRRDRDRQQRLMMLGRMAASVAHEVRNPLHTLHLVMDDLDRDVPEFRDHELREHIDSCLGRINHAVELVYHLARPGSDDQESCDAVRILREVIDAYGLEDRSRQFHLSEMPERQRVRCPPSALRMMIDNLLRNAVQASEADRSITISMTVSADRVQIRICNPGSLPPEILRAQGQTLEAGVVTRGLGLGLSIARHLAEHAQGSLRLASENGEVRVEIELLCDISGER